jgi:hypothetical protein
MDELNAREEAAVENLNVCRNGYKGVQSKVTGKSDGFQSI